MTPADRAALAQAEALMAAFDARRQAHVDGCVAGSGEDKLKHRGLAMRFHEWRSLLAPVVKQMERELR